jgi:hypothetical protein
MLCAGATGVERFSIWIALPTDGSGCLLLNGDFGTSPLYRHLSGGNGPIRRKFGYIRHYLRTHGNIREDTALHTPCPFRVNRVTLTECRSLPACTHLRTCRRAATTGATCQQAPFGKEEPLVEMALLHPKQRLD